MASEESAPTTEVPVKVPQPADGAPPSLAEPASGTVAEMSGALPAEKSTETEPVQNTGTATANGPVETVSEPPKEPQEPVTEPEAVAPTAEDTETKETDDAETAQPETNGAAPADKKSSSRRKSSTAPDHKSKKLNKKKSMSKITHLDAQPGDYYLARLKGYPPWPSIIADEDMLPDIMINTRPVTTKKDDGTYNEAYADGGKKMNERTFPIMFLGTNEFVWIHNTDLAPLTPEDCKDVTEKGKAKALLAAYKVAAEGHDLQFFKTMLDEHAAALQADIDAKEAREAEKVAKAEKKKKRKSEAKAEADDVEMEDADADVEPKKSSKKRKKEVDEDEDEDEKPAKTPKTTKIKLTTNKTPKTEEKKPKEKATKARSEKRKSRAAQEDEEMADAVEPEPEEKPLDPVEARKAREKEVLFLRHKLQKGFLSRDQAPQEDEMPMMATYIKKLEGYADLEVSIIRTTKINKVLKALIKLNTIPRDEEFQFRKRSMDLLSQWNKILGAEPADGDAAGDKDTATNGVHDEKSEEAPEEDKKEESSVPPEKPAEAAEEKPTGEPEVEKPAADAEPGKAVAEEPKPAEAEEPAKTEAAVPETVEKAPESAAAATEAADVVKAAE
ncbi:hypothetical protein, variant 2 [Cladophialophora immunda]|uniref:PWWP domain-containing protein n=1 Tax=Cladophialophora immunda TaxID=569365 RepID=A0A0D2CPD6_9EURO|nr:uncharacterized protein PV07_04564 [Cladophialophora immunda]XP_016253283.1 hypothetical protein, variant 1 [Cladophialophora immunda]XP_016253284.1 hypothetical protein, variant 2 [Cladophialophora immunda]KIW33066.1 hypothetical protein PV07_04564 [Cladophialophora immunda]KIW33067.1 hypothetical protein, variant 1 [Cladophialophora immunda]KIW33068.1 hypothetical protein, variant 2 [Cladophialophora immunda]